MKHLFLAVTLVLPTLALADPPEVEAVRVQPNEDSYRFSVTLLHPDTGWDHYADGWEVLTPDGTQLGFRELLHPHETEQPFTRSLGGVVVPLGVSQVMIRAKCSVDGWNEAVHTVELGR